MILGCAGFFIAIPYTTSERYVVYGFPFMAFALDARGHDYIGLLTLPAIAGNFLSALFSVHLGYWLAGRHRPTNRE